MAGLSLSPSTRDQLAAIARVRWQLFSHSLRTVRGRLELVSRILAGISFGVLGLGGAVGIGIASWYFLSHGKSELIALLLWPILLFWQIFPVMATAFTENIDSSNLLRFPLSFPGYFLVRMVYGSLDPSTAIGSLWLLAMAVGAGRAEARLFPWALTVCAAFALMNILLARMIFSWLERWLARRRTREIMGVLFLVVVIGFQFIGPAVNHFGKGSDVALTRAVAQLLPAERILPPGLAAASMADAQAGSWTHALGSFTLLCGYGVAFLWLLNFRLRAQYLGENLSEGMARVAPQKQKGAIQEGWSAGGIPAPVMAVLEKEYRYLSRSGPMLFTLVMPVVILLIFRVAPTNSGKANTFLLHAPNLAFPVGAAYALLVLTNLIYNVFGADGPGIQFFFMAPVPFREILLGKNLTHALVLVIDTLLVWVGVVLLFRPPALEITLATIAALLFALPVNLAAGNILSIYSPKKYDYSTLGRQRLGGTSVLLSMGIQMAVFALAALVMFLAIHFHAAWVATPVFLVLAAGSITGYALVLSRAEKIALDHRETLISTLSRA